MESESPPVDVRKLCALRQPTRVVVFVKPQSPHWSTSPEQIISQALSLLEINDASSLYLIHEKWTYLRMIAFDIYHESYRFELGHIVSDIPVIRVDYAKGKGSVSNAKFYQTQINKIVARYHNMNGWNAQLPFFADYTSSIPPRYKYPRELKSAAQQEELEMAGQEHK